jgi:hypothetical protein
MSARRSAPKASAPPKAPAVAKKGGLRLEHVLSVGMSNMSINKAVSAPPTSKKPSFAMAHKAPIVNVGISMLRKTLGVVPRADIGVNWDNWAPGQEDAKVQEWFARIAQVQSIYPNNGMRNQVYQLVAMIESMGNPNGIAGPGSVNRGYYIYLLQVLEQALRSAQVQGSDDRRFARDWAVIIKKVDQDTANLAFNALLDPYIPNDVKANIFAYFDFVNKSIYNFFTQGNLMANPSLADKTSPKLTAYLMSLVNPPEDVRDLSDILRGMSSDPRRESPM